MVRRLQLELEWLAETVRKDAGLEEDDFADAVDVATRILGEDSIVYDEGLSTPAFLRRRANGAYEIALKPGQPDVRFRIFHEISHVAIWQRLKLTLSLEEEERAANYVAAAIMAPAPMVRRAHAHFGNGFQAIKPIAKCFGMSPTSAELRVGEVVGDGEHAVATKSGNILLANFTARQLAFPWRDAPRATGRDCVVRSILDKARDRGFAAQAGHIDAERIAIRVK